MTIQLAMNGVKCLPEVGGLYLLHSHVNHADRGDANLIVADETGTFEIAVRATKDIYAGDELFFDYFLGVQDTKDRNVLKAKYGIQSS